MDHTRFRKRKNAYLIQDDQGNVLGTYNSRQIKPHREAKLKPDAELNVIEMRENISTINNRMVQEFVDKMTKNSIRDTESVKCKDGVNTDTEKNTPLIRSEKKNNSSRVNNRERKLPPDESKETREMTEEDTLREESEEIQGNPAAGRNLKKKRKSINDKYERDVLIWGDPIRASTPLNPSTSGEEKSKPILKNKRSRISEKGMRHIKRLMDVISGRKGLPFLMGTVESLQTKIIMDTRREFNVITRAAVNKIEKMCGN